MALRWCGSSWLRAARCCVEKGCVDQRWRSESIQAMQMQSARRKNPKTRKKKKKKVGRQR
jgi:hypothetical protein